MPAGKQRDAGFPTQDDENLLARFCKALCVKEVVATFLQVFQKFVNCPVENVAQFLAGETMLQSHINCQPCIPPDREKGHLVVVRNLYHQHAQDNSTARQSAVGFLR